MQESVKTSLVEGVSIVTLNRPAAYNAFGAEMVTRLGQELMAVSTNPEVKAVVLTGAGKAFCAGGDLKWLTGFQGSYGQAFHTLAAAFHQAILEIRRMPKPVFAAINGIAAGGGFSMALASDFRVMERSAVLRQGYTSNGLCLDGGGTFTLPRLVGLARAMEIAAFDRPIPSDKALEWGLVTEVVEDGCALSRSLELIQAVRKGSPFSFAAAKGLMTDSFHTPFEAQLEKERDRLAACADHPNGREGISAFLEKRNPVYP